MANSEAVTKLPDKPSDLLLIALADLESCERDPRYEIDTGMWHSPSKRRAACYVCLAGSVMARRGLIKPTVAATPSYFDADTESKLHALNELRVGEIDVALEYLGLDLPSSLPGYYEGGLYELSYSTDRSEWKQHMLSIVGILQAEGL